MKQLLVITALISPLCLIVSTQVLAQTQPTEAEIQQACANRQIDKLPAPFSDVPSYHWASEAVANLYYCKSARRNASTSGLKTAPDKVTINGRSYGIDAYLWRNFMPSTTPNNKGIMANVRLKAQDGKPVASTLTVDKLWLIKSNGETVWETTFSEQPRISNSGVEMVVRGGPNLEPDSVVDVVVRLRNGNKTYLVRSPDQKIQRTY
ncbi:hypothetical protein H6G81_11420 [Scytonema hofmannii FACHB-248]|uniref:Uncharacterized protein n=1 Tax=Scytonema hofmannii FACHB-248 TaxID=1842502 RepID=A0ABR8GPN6_9CYAN|nr:MULTISPECIES: hypothetical protein [Nostocales]MBD2605123.1 hypothetical protein [Scytonema hofmannii FACHB-248]